MMDGFNLSSPLVCEGIIGDGCGGGRLFFVEEETLFAYDPMSKKRLTLLKDITDALTLCKKACVVTITCKNKNITLDLSTLS